MYKNNYVFFPKEIYMNINFKFVKDSIASNFDNYKDYGSIVIVRNEDVMMSINNIGKVQLFYDDINQDDINRYVVDIESLFKKQVDDFAILLQ